MRFVGIIILLGMFSGCSKISNIAPDTGTETTQTGDPVYDSQSEMRVLLPWDWLI